MLWKTGAAVWALLALQRDVVTKEFCCTKGQMHTGVPRLSSGHNLKNSAIMPSEADPERQ